MNNKWLISELDKDEVVLNEDKFHVTLPVGNQILMHIQEMHLPIIWNIVTDLMLTASEYEWNEIEQWFEVLTWEEVNE